MGLSDKVLDDELSEAGLSAKANLSGKSDAYKGVLYIVATPIGHLADMSFRAIEILKSVDCIFAEDTRHAKKCLMHYQIKTRCLSLHEHNEKNRVALVAEQLSAGLSVALISDAGTPLISDPGYVLVREMKTKGFLVSPVPGACAAIAALSVSGLATDRFVFEGFLSAKSAARCKRLMQLQDETRTIVFYESCHRLLVSLNDMLQILGGSRQAFVGRELTKAYEEMVNGSLSEIYDFFEDKRVIKGECVLVVSGAVQKNDELESVLSQPELTLLAQLKSKMSPKEVAGVAHAVFGKKKKCYYSWLVAN